MHSLVSTNNVKYKQLKVPNLEGIYQEQLPYLYHGTKGSPWELATLADDYVASRGNIDPLQIIIIVV